MVNERFRCRHCRRMSHRRTSEQRYCGGEECQRARKNAWRSVKLAVDADYPENQRASNDVKLHFVTLPCRDERRVQ